MKYIILAVLLWMSPALFAQAVDSLDIELPESITVAPQNEIMIPADADTIQISGDVATSDSITVVITEESDNQNSTLDSVESSIPGVRDVISFSKIFMAISVLILVWLITGFIVSVLTNLSERFSSYRLLIKRLIPITKVFIWSLSLYFIIAGILQPPLETIITVSASIGIAVGFASQDILRNIFGGIMIILDRPFQVGDKIEVDKQYGEVLQIGLRSVRVVTEDDSVVTIPNSEIVNKSVSNANSSALDCQVVAELFLPRDTDVDEVERICRLAAVTSRFVYLNKPVYVHTTHITVGPKDYLKFG